MERLINRRQQGDLGEASAVDWLTRAGAVVFLPLGHSPDVDLIADFGDRLVRVQVKTSTYRRPGTIEDARWVAALCTRGGNRSWQGISKRLNRTAIDYLFVLVGDGRRWLIPADAIGAVAGITLGGRKYGEYEVEPTQPIADLVYGSQSALLDSAPAGGAPE